MNSAILLKVALAYAPADVQNRIVDVLKFESEIRTLQFMIKNENRALVDSAEYNLSHRDGIVPKVHEAFKKGYSDGPTQ